MLHDLGHDLISGRGDIVAVREAVAKFDREFDLVLLTERFEESLVLLRDR